MKFRNAVLAVSVLFLFLLGACSKPAATVNGRKISRETLEMHLKEKIEEHKRQNVNFDEKKLREATLQELVGEMLTLDEASAKGISVPDAEVAKEIDAVRQRLGDDLYQKSLREKGLTSESFTRRLKEKMILSKFLETFAKEGDITEDEMTDYYKKSQKPFLKPARVNMKIVEFQTEEAANAAARDLTKAADFDAYARRLAEENKANVTDYGWVSPDFFSPAMAASVKGLKTGQHGGPYKGQKGFYIVRVKDKENETISKYEEVRDTIRTVLLQQRRSAAYMQWLKQKRDASKIVINVS